MKIKLHKNDLPENIKLNNSIAIDTEAMGLNYLRDRLCLVQLTDNNGTCHLIKIESKLYKPTNLIKILKNKKIVKIFHYARFDVALLKHSFSVNIENIYCTKIASKLARTYTDKHGYKDLCKELLNKEISKTEQTTNWGQKKLTLEQQKYAATDVFYLHKIKEKLDKILIKENRMNLAKNCFNFIKTRTELDLLGWSDQDIFKH